jgi:hypothetical protein
MLAGTQKLKIGGLTTLSREFNTGRSTCQKILAQNKKNGPLTDFTPQKAGNCGGKTKLTDVIRSNIIDLNSRAEFVNLLLFIKVNMT